MVTHRNTFYVTVKITGDMELVSLDLLETAFFLFFFLENSLCLDESVIHFSVSNLPGISLPRTEGNGERKEGMEGRVKSRQQKLTGSRPPASSTGYSD